MPPPKVLGDRRIAWDVRRLDIAVDSLPDRGGIVPADDTSWEDIDAS
jgi:hypothetical protein